MPRAARLDAPGVLHHIIIHGIERRDIFLNEADREDLIDRLSDLIPATGTACYAWAFLGNHTHFLFRTGNVPLSALMRRLITGYAVSFNRRQQRIGHLFQNRYKSIVCQEDVYLKELLRYIHLNPLRAGIVSDVSQLAKYPYCGHSAIIGKTKKKWQDTGYVLGYFGIKVHSARKAYLEYMEAGSGQGPREELTGGGLIRSIGGWQEVKKQKGVHRMLVLYQRPFFFFFFFFLPSSSPHTETSSDAPAALEIILSGISNFFV